MKPVENALIVVDYQNGFIPETASGVNELPVEWGELLAPRINALMQETKQAWGLIIATRDWHPKWHMSFARNYLNREPFSQIWWEDAMNHQPSKLELSPDADFTEQDLQIEFGANKTQILWPDHCIANTPGSEYFTELDTALIDRHIIKWYDPRTEMYSWFFWKEQRDDDETVRLTDILKNAGVKVVKVVGLATDFCVRATAIDSVKNGVRTIIDSSAIAGVGVKTPEETIAYLQRLREEHDVEYV